MISFAFLLFVGAFPAIAGGLVDRPEHCLRDGVFPCAVGTSSRTELVLQDKKEVLPLALEAGAKLLLHSARDASVIDGEIAFRTDKKFRLRHGSVNVDVEARALVSRAGRELSLSILDGEARIRKPSGADEVLVSGLRQTVGSIDAISGAIVTKVAEPYDFQPITIRWLQLVKLDGEGVRTSLKRFRGLWKTSVEVAAAGYAKEMGRQLASKEKKVEEALDEEALLRLRNQRLRELFRKKSLDRDTE